MPAIASLEDLKAAQSLYAMLYALCAMLQGNGGRSVGKMSASFGFRNAHQNN